MITLDGDVAEISGAMQGGYRSKRPAMGFTEKEISSDIERCESEAQELGNTLQALENRRAENEEKITKLRQEKANLEGEILKVEKTLHLAPTDLDTSKEKKEELKEQLQKLEKEVNEIINKISAKNKELANKKIEKQNLKNKISELRDPALLAELAAFEEKRNQI